MRDPCGKVTQAENDPIWEMGTHGGEICEVWGPVENRHMWREDKLLGA